MKRNRISVLTVAAVAPFDADGNSQSSAVQSTEAATPAPPTSAPGQK